MDIIDLIFAGVIVLIVAGGLACLFIFLPKEKDFDEKHANSYRIMYRDGSYSITHKKALFGENLWSIRSKYFYIQKSPFTVDAFCDEAVGKDGKTYRGTAEMTLYFPEEKLQVFAPNFHNVGEDAVLETVSEAASAALEDAVKEYDGSEPFDAFCKKTADEKMSLFGLIVMSIKNLNVTKIAGKDAQEQ
ncbi:MAG: hypothetical protein IJS94_07330 [Clostridia bacterium]|nr:hypothetical protein [Clostridia bacterium]